MDHIWGAYGGFWETGGGTVDDSNVLLGFTVPTSAGAVNAGTYSTGVNDALLTANAVVYTPVNYQTLKPSGTVPTSGGSNTYLATTLRWLGRPTDRTATDPNPTDTPLDPAWYLSSPGMYAGSSLADHGLELGSAIFNLPAQTLKFSITLSDPSQIGDGVPDIIGTQMGDVGASDVYRFVDSAGNTVGNTVAVNFGTTPSVGEQSWAFYSPAGVPVSAAIGGVRSVRIVAFDFGDFGITAANYLQITGFEQQLNGQSDVAFVAYNTAAMKVKTDDLKMDASINAAAAFGVCSGDAVAFSVAVSNLTAGVTANDVVVKVQLPPGFSNVSGITPSQGSFDAVTGLWSVGSVAGGASATLKFSAVASMLTGVFTTRIDSQDGVDVDNSNDSASVNLGPKAICPIAASNNSSVPTLDELSLALLGLLLAGGAAARMLRKH